MRKSALLIAAGFALLAPSMAQAQNGKAQTWQGCCQDTIKLFQRGADAWREGPKWEPYKPVAWQPYKPQAYGTPPCCQDTINLFWRGVDAWTGYKPTAAKGGKKKRG